MATAIVNNTGSGKIKDDSIIGFSYSEDATPIDPLSSDGGTSQVTISAIEEPGTGINNSKLMINNTITLTDSNLGSVQAQVKKIDVNAAGIVTLTADSLSAKLNVIKTAQPYSGTLGGALTYYCQLCDPTITPIIDSALNSVNVNYIGWNGYVWEYIKSLCSVASASASNRSPIEAYFTGTNIGFRPVATNAIDMASVESDISESINAFDAALNVSLYNYNTRQTDNDIIYDLANYEPTLDPTKAFLSSISDTMSVNAGETITKRFSVDTSLTSIQQPTCVAQITRPLPYNPNTSAPFTSAYFTSFGDGTGSLAIFGDMTAVKFGNTVKLVTTGFTAPYDIFNNAVVTPTADGTLSGFNAKIVSSLPSSGPLLVSGTANIQRNGQYVVVGVDNLPIQPSQWIATGGSLTVSLTENPNEIEVTITAPPEPSLGIAADDTQVTYAPYKIGVEATGDGIDYPAIYFTGAGIKYNKQLVTVATGADESFTTKDAERTVDNIFITDSLTLANASLVAAQSSCNPAISMSGTSIPTGFTFGGSIGSTFKRNGVKMRVQSLAFSDSSVSWSASKYTTFADFDAQNTGKTFSQFDTIVGGSQPISFNEFSIIPLTAG